MPDVVDPKTRSRMMSGIKGKNTQPELIIRRALHRLGFRYRIHAKNLPGKPDMVFPCRRAVIMINGCFWHGHDCHLFKWPSSKVDFWREKIIRTKEKDAETREALKQQNWRVLTIWECALKGRTRWPREKVVATTAVWLEEGSDDLDIRGD